MLITHGATVLLFYVSFMVLSRQPNNRFIKNLPHIQVVYKTNFIKRNWAELTYQKVLETKSTILNSTFFLGEKKNITEVDYKFTIIPREGCNNDTFLAIFVLTVHKSFLVREVIRNTWGTVSRNNKWPGSNAITKAKVMFVFGRSTDPLLDNVLTMEGMIHGDILQGDFTEHYSNLTLKVVTALRFAKQYCPNVQYILKADDDTFTDVDRLVRFLKNSNPNNSILGYVRTKELVLRVGKYEMPRNVYPLSMFPNYAYGVTYVLSMDVVSCIISYARRFRYFRIEDVFIAGVLVRSCNISLVHVPTFADKQWGRPQSSDLLKGDKVSVVIETKASLNLWRDLKKSYGNLPTEL